MNLFFEILATIIFPVFVLIGVGVLMDRLFFIDVQTLSKFNFYLFLPAVLFVALLNSDLNLTLFGTVAGFTVTQLMLLLGISWALFGSRPFRKYQRVLTLGGVYYNGGNYGLPLILLAFGPESLTVMAIVLMVQNLIGFTLGIWLIGSEKQTWKGVVRGFLAVPSVYAIVAALILNAANVLLPQPVQTPLQYLADALIPMALLMLGVQISRSRIADHIRAVVAVSVVRLILSPLLAMGLVAIWAALLSPQILAIAPILITIAGVPVAVTVYAFSIEYQQNPNLASQMILWTTLISAFTITLWLMIFN